MQPAAVFVFSKSSMKEEKGEEKIAFDDFWLKYLQIHSFHDEESNKSSCFLTLDKTPAFTQELKCLSMTHVNFFKSTFR